VEATAARERVLTAAEQLFSARGYAAVTLRDIADALGIKQASLYYHVPGGKEALFVEVMLRGMERHRAGLETALRAGGADLRDQLRAAARWLLSQPPMNFGRMMQSDMPAITADHAERLRAAANRALLAPLEAAFEAAAVVDTRAHAVYLAGAFLAIIETIHGLPEAFSPTPRIEMADYLIDVLVRGLRS
jgi:AcrR family transcriptional regulator